MSGRRHHLVLVCVALALTTLAALAAAHAASGAAPAVRPAVVAVHTSTAAAHWLTGLRATHRALFDAPAPAGGAPLTAVLRYLDRHDSTDAAAMLAFYGGTTLYALDDAAWARYHLGEILGVVDPASGRPATANPWRTAPLVHGTAAPRASLEALQRRGTTLLLCDNALHVYAGLVAARRALDADAVYRDLRANMLPGVTLVPGIALAIEEAQRAGVTYERRRAPTEALAQR